MRRLALFFVLLLAAPLTAFAQSGKIAGTVTDADTGEPIPGVNVVVDGTTVGATTDVEGFYAILGVRPGTYAVRASFIGYAPQTVQGVRVNIDQTTTVDIALREEVIEGEEVVVTAERPVVQRDVSASQANITSEEVTRLPVASVTGAVGLQAGVQGLSIRGSGSDEVAFMLNGLSLRDERDNTPFTSISLAAVEEVQVQTGGFNAEYGNVRSGVVNVITKEGGRSRYGADLILRYSPPGAKQFGPLPNDPDSYWIRPYLDPEVAYSGTNAWDEATRAQYPGFNGWIAVSEELLADDDPTNDMTPEALMEAFRWQHRKTFAIETPDYTADVGFGGPVPGLNAFGDTRFYASYRRDQDAYLFPLSRDRYASDSGTLKFTSNLATGMKLSLESLYGRVTGTSASSSGQPGLFRSAFGIANAASQVSFIDTRLFAESYWAPTEVTNFMLGGTFTHTLSPSTFYEIRGTRFASDYSTTPGDLRDTTAVVTIGGVAFNEAPFGFLPTPSAGVDGMRMSVGMSTARDTSRVVTWNVKSDITSQVNRYLQAKAGLEYNLTQSNIRYGRYDAYLPASNTLVTWDRTPTRAAAYAQGKLEFQGMIANLGLRFDYAYAGGEWYAYEDFTDAFSARNAARFDTLIERTSPERHFALSPRLGVSFPVTATSKLYFNYGHFRSMPNPNDLYLIQYFGATNRINRIANPNNPLPKTIAYEGGFEQALFDQFLVRVAGYYKDVSDQPRLVRYISRDGQTDYFRSEPVSYEDIRGFEFTFARNVGRWVQGFVNYTYMVRSFGYFGFDQVNENPTVQRRFEASDAERRAALTRPTPLPYGRLNLDVLVPDGFGPNLGGLRPLADWRVSFLGAWQAGSPLTWTGGGSVPGVRNNVNLPDYWNWDLRFKRQLDVAGTGVEFFIDVYNLFNTKRLTFNGFVDGNDYNAYFRSLHFPESTFEDFPNGRPSSYIPIFGDDQPGDYRDEDVAFVPMRGIANRTVFSAAGDSPLANAIYYEAATDRFIEFAGRGDGGELLWQDVDPDRLQEVLDAKAYIDMPNLGYQSFLNPRDIFFGVRLSF